MEISGTYRFNATPDVVWAVLMDPTIISMCIPGCDALEPEGENRFRARLTVPLTAIVGTYDGTVEVSDLVAGSSYRLTAEGRGKQGFVKGSSFVSLHADGAATIVHVTRYRANGRHDRTSGSTARRQRVEGNDGPLLRLSAVED